MRVSKEEEQGVEIAKEAQAIAADAKRDLDEAMPAYYASVDALKSLNKADVQEVTTLPLQRLTTLPYATLNHSPFATLDHSPLRNPEPLSHRR